MVSMGWLGFVWFIANAVGFWMGVREFRACMVASGRGDVILSLDMIALDMIALIMNRGQMISQTWYSVMHLLGISIFLHLQSFRSYSNALKMSLLSRVHLHHHARQLSVPCRIPLHHHHPTFPFPPPMALSNCDIFHPPLATPKTC